MRLLVQSTDTKCMVITCQGLPTFVTFSEEMAEQIVKGKEHYLKICRDIPVDMNLKLTLEGDYYERPAKEGID